MLLEEVIYVMDALGTVPTALTLSEEPDGGISGSMNLASPDVLEVHGSLPKGISLADPWFVRCGDRWMCRATIDV